jgi:hypothetical protein
VLGCDHRRYETDRVEQGEAVDDAEHVACENRSDARGTAVARHEVHSGDPLAWSTTAHRQFENGVIETVDGRRRRQNQAEPDRIGIERLRQAPRAVIRHGGDDEPGNRQQRPDGPINEKRERTRARSGYRQGNFYAGDAVGEQVRRRLQHSSAASSG